MFDSMSLKLLKALNEMNKSQGYIGSSYEVFQHLSELFPQDKIEKALVHNEERGYIKLNWFAKAINEIHLTHKGENYKEFAWVVFKEYMLKSILTPIAVAFITAIITTLVTLWLKSILHW